ncbi:MAG TPA: MoaD/ThiS family protein [Chryseosolibacter sp.]|nr:MoaD/ThiS family protein [Chryseosolibacter sp.]
MGKYKVKAFGITKDIVGGKETVVELEGQTVAALRNELQKKYPGLVELRSLLIAVNNAYADDLSAISEHDEIALIPPVSGG